jgi:AcrR family transcriptional regulator
VLDTVVDALYDSVEEAELVGAQPVNTAANRTAPTANPKVLDGFGAVAGNILDIVSINYGTHGAAANQAVDPPRRGRPRSTQVRAAVLRAAADLALAGGPDAATIDAIAKRAAVSRTTIYKWWPSSAAIVLEGLLDSARDSITQPPNGSSKEALEHQLRALNAILTDAATGPLLRNVVAASASEPEVTEAVFDEWLQPRRAAVDAILRRAAAQGEIRDGADIEVIVDALVSPPCYRLLFALPPLDDAALTQLLETVWRGCQRPAGL